MKKLSWIATLVVGTVIAAPASAFPYKVKSGDTLSRLAHRFGTTVAAIQAANDLPDTMIFVDETIEIPQGTPDEPETAPSTTANPNERSYVVRSGDSLSRIAAMFDTHVQAIRDLNGMTGNLIHPGQHLRIPAPIVENDAPAGDAVTHTVAPGEWLSLIADRYDVSVEDLRLANGMAPGENMIHPGQVLTIPVAGTSGAPRDLLAVNAPAMSASDASSRCWPGSSRASARTTCRSRARSRWPRSS